jgi:hypothetical protein
VHPKHRRPGPGDFARIAAELERQESFGLARLPENLRAFLDRLPGRPAEPGALGEAGGPV